LPTGNDAGLLPKVGPNRLGATLASAGLLPKLRRNCPAGTSGGFPPWVSPNCLGASHCAAGLLLLNPLN